MNCEWLLNDADNGEVSSTLTTGHHREMNILAPRGA